VKTAHTQAWSVRLLAVIAAAAPGGLASPAAASTDGVDVVTYHNDALRTGQNLAEHVLTPSNVAPGTFGLLRTLAVDGKVDAQPLVLHDYPMADQRRHEVVYAATEHASVYAYDPSTGVLLWQVSLLPPGETPSDARDCSQVMPEIGVTATPVIDRAGAKLFVVAMSKDGAGKYHQRLHALSLASGAELQAAVEIRASVRATGAPGARDGRLVFDPGQYKERSALLLDHGVIYTSWASHCDKGDYTGWIIAYAAADLHQTAVFNTEPSGALGSHQGEASFWNSNSGPAADPSGTLFVMTANGAFDTRLTPTGFPAGADYGNSILKLSPTVGGALEVSDYFTMYDANRESDADVDLGSGGLLLLPDQQDAAGRIRHLAVGAGKDRNIYVVDRDALGKFDSKGNRNAYQFLAAAFPNLGCGRGVYGAPVYFDGMVYTEATGDVIRAFRLSQARFPAQGETPVATMTTHASFCYPGPPLSVSAAGSTNAILWAVENSTTQAVLHAYDAEDLQRELYSSAASGTRDQFGPGSKYTPPTVANGKVLVATQADNRVQPAQQNSIAVFGLLPRER
jgi:outer membrane protein assembly factor BamB